MAWYLNFIDRYTKTLAVLTTFYDYVHIQSLCCSGILFPDLLASAVTRNEFFSVMILSINMLFNLDYGHQLAGGAER